MATRIELLDEYEAKLNGFLLRCDAHQHPVTEKWLQKNQNWKPLPDLRSSIVEVEQDPDGDQVVERHITFFWDDDQNVKGNVQFYVKNRGQPDEEAIWLQSKDPKPPAPPETFQQKVTAWLHSKVGHIVGAYTIRHVTNISADQVAKTATTRVLVEEAGTVKWLEVYLWLDEANNVRFEVIPGM